MRLASSFASNAHILRANRPLTDDEIRHTAPSVFADAAHDSRSARYTFIPTAEPLAALRREGFQPMMVCQTRVRQDDRREFTKHMIRLRHTTQVNGEEANEIILLNSHDGTSSFQLLAGMFRFVCHNGLVCGNVVDDIRVHHKGDIVGRIIEGAYEVLRGFDRIDTSRDAMRAVALDDGEALAFARSALTLKYDASDKPAPITEQQLLTTERHEDRGRDLWTTFNRVQEHLIRGGLPARNATGRRVRTRGVHGIDQNIHVNRALWILADEMRKLKSK
ncbi:DUF932 domain-containing protein [Burkholderia cepacia]|uniref:DUF932 domain-containing protein n=1 Tax=Burkholderia cepacia TaxID=292 RepID=UPI00158D9397|nr:DUF932 domain-containing protein [Burkholderia cepacia]